MIKKSKFLPLFFHFFLTGFLLAQKDSLDGKFQKNHEGVVSRKGYTNFLPLDEIRTRTITSILNLSGKKIDTFTLDAGTKVIIIDQASGVLDDEVVYKVVNNKLDQVNLDRLGNPSFLRVLVVDGKSKGKHGWVPIEIINKNNPQSEANDPCKDEVFRRLLNEKYQKEVLDKLKELKTKYALQPLGSRGPTTLNGDGVPNAFISSDLPFANYDRYAITIPASHLPNGFNPELELAKWPNNMNSVPKPGSSGSDAFNSSNVFRPLRTEPILGDLIGIHIPSKPFQAAMILATGSTQDVTVMITDKKPCYFRVSTLETDVRLISGSNARLRHPVSGSREFGFIRNQNGSVTFYTQGLDSPTSDAVNSIGADTQAEGWKGFMSGLGERFGLSPEDAKSSVEKESFTNRSLKNRPNCD